MREPTPGMLEDVLGEVLQEAAFVFAEPADEPERWNPPVLTAEIAFESVRGGILRLALPPRGAVEIAANMLGVDPCDPEAEEHGRAAVAEILNVIGGVFVTRFFGTQVQTQLGLPRTALVESPAVGARTCAATLQLETGEPVVLELDLEPAAA
jgi:Chemotaxis phosphatase CheX